MALEILRESRKSKECLRKELLTVIDDCIEIWEKSGGTIKDLFGDRHG